jgi:hypothetical protein
LVKIKNDVFVYAEGGGKGNDSSASQAEFRQAFAAFFSKTLLGTTRRPRVVTCGGRDQAFAMFTTAIAQGKNALLLVDSEDNVAPAHEPPPAGNWQPWAHLSLRDGWQKPARANDDDCHLMAPCMESWFLADWTAVGGFFGQGFTAAPLPTGPIEAVAKQDVYTALKQASKDCKTKAVYGKGAHSFKLLSLIDPTRVMAASPWAARFVQELGKRKP